MEKLKVKEKESKYVFLLYEYMLKNCLINSFELLLCRRYYNISILKFESQEDILTADKTKINLLKEGFIRSFDFQPRVEELEIQIPGFQNLMWDIVENNMIKNNNESEIRGSWTVSEKRRSRRSHLTAWENR